MKIQTITSPFKPNFIWVANYRFSNEITNYQTFRVDTLEKTKYDVGQWKINWK